MHTGVIFQKNLRESCLCVQEKLFPGTTAKALNQWICSSAKSLAALRPKKCTSLPKASCLIAENFSPSSLHAPIPEVAYLRSTLAGSQILLSVIPVISFLPSTPFIHLATLSFLHTCRRTPLRECRNKKDLPGVPDFPVHKSNSKKEPFCGYEKTACIFCTVKK